MGCFNSGDVWAGSGCASPMRCARCLAMYYRPQVGVGVLCERILHVCDHIQAVTPTYHRPFKLAAFMPATGAVVCLVPSSPSSLLLRRAFPHHRLGRLGASECGRIVISCWGDVEAHVEFRSSGAWRWQMM